MTDMRKLIESLNAIEEETNPTDTVTVDIPLLIRLLEFAKEDAKTDMDLHQLAENLINLSPEGNTLTMSDYDELVTGLAGDENAEMDFATDKNWRDRYGQHDEQPADEE